MLPGTLRWSFSAGHLWLTEYLQCFQLVVPAIYHLFNLQSETSLPEMDNVQWASLLGAYGPSGCHDDHHDKLLQLLLFLVTYSVEVHWQLLYNQFFQYYIIHTEIAELSPEWWWD